ncbi:S-adenosyl-L-methionine-dependent methyltransferase [Aspergillus insuetus]
MEDKLAGLLDLFPRSYVLDAGFGDGHVAIRLASKHGLRVEAIDIVDHHLHKARENIARPGLPQGQVRARKMDYHHLESLPAETFDGIYTIETFVHATDPEAVLAGGFRTLRPGGHLAMHEYDNELPEGSPKLMAHYMHKINEIAAMPTNSLLRPRVLQRMLEDAGFTNVVVRGYSNNIRPMTRFFSMLALIPCIFVIFLGLERYFINTTAGIGCYYGRKHWRYLAFSATKPGPSVEAPKDR